MSNKEVEIKGAKVEVARESNINDELYEKALNSKVFVDWLNRVNSPLSDGLTFHKITIQSVDLFGPRVGYLFFYFNSFYLI